MKREIKFRAWDKDLRIMQTPFIDFIKFEESESFRGASILHQDFPDDEFVSSEVMQYTGIKDRNGKEIYEGDFCKSLRGLFLVEWENASFKLKAINKVCRNWCLTHHSAKSLQVIGNICENADIIE